LDRRELWESTAIPDGSRLTTVHPGCSGVAVAEGEEVAVAEGEEVAVPGVVCAGLGVAVATLRGAATGEEDEQAATVTPAIPRASTMLIAR
jgi:hypothetical protein